MSLSSGDVTVLGEFAIAAVPAAGASVDTGTIAVTFPEVGVYFLRFENSGVLQYASSVECGSLKQLDLKFLPDSIPYTEDGVIKWNGNKDGLVHVLFDHPTSGNDWGDYNFYKVSNVIPNVKAGDTVTMLDDGGNPSGSRELVQENENILTTTTGSREFVIVLSDNADYSFTFYADYSGTFPEAGVYFRDVLDSTGGIRPRTYGVDFGEIVHQLDPKYIPVAVKEKAEQNVVIETRSGADTIKCSHSFEEAKAAIENGMSVIWHIKNWASETFAGICSLIDGSTSDDTLCFVFMQLSENGVFYYRFTFTKDGTITYENYSQRQ